MGAKYTSAQAKACANYMKNKKQIKVTVSEEAAEKIKSAADQEGKNVTQFILECIEEHLREGVADE